MAGGGVTHFSPPRAMIPPTLFNLSTRNKRNELA
jgi:hypothetical protein